MTLRSIVKVIKEGDVTLKDKNGEYITTMEGVKVEKYISKEMLDSEIEEIKAVSNGTISVKVGYDGEREDND